MDSAADPRLADAVRVVRALTPLTPRVGIVLGSGLGAFAESLSGVVKIPYSEVPHMRPAGVLGHAGCLAVGRVGTVPVVCLSGRVHLYEGHAADDVVFGCRLIAALGAQTVLLTNAAGGIRSGFAKGSLMLVVDHVNLTGKNPLVGKSDGFVDMTRAYDAAVANAARAAAAANGIELHEGVYAGVAGPSYETPAEIRMLRTLGADAVGMSTVLETIALRHAGVRVGAVSSITNLAAGLSAEALDHRDVQSTAEHGRASFTALIERWVGLCAELPDMEE